jgi:rsbT co-antagonist protein RsbR
MSYSPWDHLPEFLEAHQRPLLEAWLSDLHATWQHHPLDQIGEDELRTQTWQLLEEIRKVFATPVSEQWIPPSDGKLCRLLRELSTLHAKQDIKPSDTAVYVLGFKKSLYQLLQEPVSESRAGMDSLSLLRTLECVDHVVNRLALFTIEAYVETRQRIIAQQSLSLMELSTPVVRLWDRLILLPLVGVVDTERARQITERMLEAIAKYEATVAIIDVTGVPVMDTGVAGHLMKTMAAAQMLGARVIMTGVTPEGAQTLVKLGINFGDIISRATLRAGVAEGLRLLGLQVSPLQRNLP